MRQAALERILSKVPLHPSPSAELEQYRTPDRIAAELLLEAFRDGAIEGKAVVDPGCGTGVFAIGAAVLGASVVHAFDVDATAVDAAREAARSAGVADRIRWDVADTNTWMPPEAVDTAIMNPPFGAQKANRHADKMFLERSLAWVGRGTVWFLAQEHTEVFLTAFARDEGCRIERVGSWDYPLQAQFAFHRNEAVHRRVNGYRLQKTG